MRRARQATTRVISMTILAASVLMACTSGGGVTAAPSATTPATAQPTATAAPTPVAAPVSSTSVDPSASAAGAVIAQSFDIGGGRTLFLTCEGTGSPTIFLESGDESDISQWRLVMPSLARETRTCAYERAGNGRSPSAEGCRQLDDLLGDTEALLAAANIKGPFVLVGTSGGGFLMSGFAARHPADVAGLVLVETPKAITIMPPGLKELIACDAPTNIERRDYAAVEHAVWDNRKEIGDFPMTIISNDYGVAAPPNDDAQTNVPDQKGWLVLSPNSKQIVVTTGHNVPEDQPDLVVREILAVLKAAQGG